jgi:hypothetical protein
MSDPYKKIFVNLGDIKPPKSLFDAILERIHAEKKRYARIKLVLHGGLAAVSFAALIPSSLYVVSEFSQSGFNQFFSLLFSDGATVISYWKEFLLLLVESLPLFSTIALLIAIVTFLGSLKFVARDTRTLSAAL